MIFTGLALIVLGLGMEPAWLGAISLFLGVCTLLIKGLLSLR